MPFYPGPGLGGHCIPIDPLYLSWKLRTLQYQARFIDLADTINSGMPNYVVERGAFALNDRAKAVRGAKVLIYGVAYKRDVSDVRESPAFPIIHGFMSRGADVSIMDPFVTSVDEEGVVLQATDPKSSFAEYDLVVIITDHTVMERERLLRESRLVLDTRDALRGISGDRGKVYGL
jgi:UDP-N-acetyl-D-glucosamine dehydrogenase